MHTDQWLHLQQMWTDPTPAYSTNITSSDAGAEFIFKKSTQAGFQLEQNAVIKTRPPWIEDWLLSFTHSWQWGASRIWTEKKNVLPFSRNSN